MVSDHLPDGCGPLRVPPAPHGERPQPCKASGMTARGTRAGEPLGCGASADRGTVAIGIEITVKDPGAGGEQARTEAMNPNGPPRGQNGIDENPKGQREINSLLRSKAAGQRGRSDPAQTPADGTRPACGLQWSRCGLGPGAQYNQH